MRHLGAIQQRSAWPSKALRTAVTTIKSREAWPASASHGRLASAGAFDPIDCGMRLAGESPLSGIISHPAGSRALNCRPESGRGDAALARLQI